MLKTKNILSLILRNTIISTIAILISVVSIYLISNEINKITDKIVLTNELENKLKNRIENFSIIERDAEIIGNNNTLIEEAFIPSNNISEFINSLDEIAKNTEVTQLYSFETPLTYEFQTEFATSSILYTNKIGTNVNNLSNYLKTFENLNYLTRIEGISISSQDSLGWVGPSDISIKATLLTKTTQ